ncbi:DUF4861 domain-containing protein [uncultured Bacteroides sp.]|uniref:DUF4861 domain-containing protein n=1 Tax=uncultured Bacteroides sp. TaxID=162156 RepID=UPI00261BECF8|nr:DUF4861 domain-containing protein [uncultured Bacteroides sp.]
MDSLQKILICLLGIMNIAGSLAQPHVELTITNPLDADRIDEIVELPLSVIDGLHLSAADKLIVLDDQQKQVPYQTTYNKKLLIPVTVKANGCSTYSLTIGIPDNMQVYACGKQYPERMDDIAWENDKAAYRAYGPATQRNGEKLYGYDIFTKSVPFPVVEKRYAMQLDPISWEQVNKLRKAGKETEADSLYHTFCYHVDHGNGMDCYSVGPTLGGGTNALLIDSTIIYPYCYKDYEILDNGPLRFSVKLTFHPFTVKKDSSVIETRIISLDKGSYLNRTEVKYNGLKTEIPIIGGIVIHPQNPDGYCFDKENGYIAYADSTDNPHNNNGIILLGALFTMPLDFVGVKWFSKDEAKQKGALGHVIGKTNYQPESIFTYYWGSGWSKADMPDIKSWDKYLLNFKKRLNEPLIINWSLID